MNLDRHGAQITSYMPDQVSEIRIPLPLIKVAACNASEA
jgi:hypothetical protein